MEEAKTEVSGREEERIKKQVIQEKKKHLFLSSSSSISSLSQRLFLRTSVVLFVFVSFFPFVPQNGSYSGCLSFSFYYVSSWVSIPSHLFLCFLYSLCIWVFSSVFLFFLWFVWLHFLFFFFTFISALFFAYEYTEFFVEGRLEKRNSE